MAKKRRYLKKETLAKNILRECWDVNDLRKLSNVIREVHGLNKEQSEKYKDRMKKLESLYKEFVDNPRSFIERYAKSDDNQKVLKMLKDNPELFRED